MSAAFKRRRKGVTVREVKVPLEAGGWVNRTAKTRDAQQAKAYQAMVHTLHETQQWWVLNRLDDRSLSVPRLWTLWLAAKKDPRALRSLLEDVDLEPHVCHWHSTLLAPSSGISIDTASHYHAAVRSLIPEGAPFLRSRFTPAVVAAWLDGMDDVAPGTVRKRAAGLRSFAKRLKRLGTIEDDPTRVMDLPAPGKPRMLYLSEAEALQLASRQYGIGGIYEAFSALLAGTGIEVSVALGLRRRDVDLEAREIRAAGTKTHSRDRVVRVAGWAWEIVAALCRDLTPNARLFETIPNRWKAADAHNAARAELVAEGFTAFDGYTMRDARHTYAVRAVRGGTPLEIVAQQLGHANSGMVVKVYGRFKPPREDRDRWEQRSAHEARKAK